MKHQFWGNIEEDWAGFSSDIAFSHLFFEAQNTEIFLGEDTDDPDEEDAPIPLSQIELDEFAQTYQQFVDNFDSILLAIQQKAFERYTSLYAHYYENEEKSGEAALNISSVAQHNKYITDLMYLRILPEKTIKISIRYQLDEEHGIEFRLENGQIAEVGGIAET